MFAAALLLLPGVLNIIWGIAAIGNANFFVADQRYIISLLSTWGWITLVLGRADVRSVLAGLRRRLRALVGMIAPGLSAISALLSIPAYPFWSLCIFALAIIILYELAKAPEGSAMA